MKQIQKQTAAQTCKFTRGDTTVEFGYQITNMFKTFDDLIEVWGTEALNQTTKYFIYHNSHSIARSKMGELVKVAIETGELAEDCSAPELEEFVVSQDIKADFSSKGSKRPTKGDMEQAQTLLDRLDTDETLAGKLNDKAAGENIEAPEVWTLSTIANLVQARRITIMSQTDSDFA
tara:strand:+ start:60 stop:587 length:528 start_codon:yes stop_codon:yes gene_type:complete